jgi:hypothetical protein
MPELLEECRFVYAAFHELVNDRQVGFGLGPIPWSAIDAYARRYGLNDIDEFERFVALVRSAEQAHAQHQRKPNGD